MTTSASDNTRVERLRELIGECAIGNQQAFETLYQLTSAQLFGILTRMLPSKAIAEEVLQESYIKIWENVDSYNAALGNPLTWMISISRNKAVDTLRKRNIRENQELDSDYSGEDYIGSLLGQDEQSIADVQILSLCLERLEAGPRNCIIKAYCEGYSHEDLSNNLDTPLGTVKSWIRRGLSALKRCVNELS